MESPARELPARVDQEGRMADKADRVDLAGQVDLEGQADPWGPARMVLASLVFQACRQRRRALVLSAP